MSIPNYPTILSPTLFPMNKILKNISRIVIIKYY